MPKYDIKNMTRYEVEQLAKKLMRDEGTPYTDLSVRAWSQDGIRRGAIQITLKLYCAPDSEKTKQYKLNCVRALDDHMTKINCGVWFAACHKKWFKKEWTITVNTAFCR